MIRTLLFLVSFLCMSCSIPRYVIQSPEQSTGIDFTTGLWLINEVDAPADYQNQLTNLAIDNFTEILGNRVSYIYNKQGLLLPQKIPFELSPTELENIQQGTGYDFLINIQAAKLKNELSSFTPGGQLNDGVNSNQVEMAVYDLNKQSKIYSQKVVGYTSRAKSNEDLHFVANSPILLVGAYKKVFNDIDKKSIK